MGNSATFDEPPRTIEDYWVVKAILLSASLTSANPDNGVHLPPARPQPYHYETRGPGIIAGCAFCIFVMLLVTGTRLYLRWFSPRLKWGVDDALMIPGLMMAVAYPAIQTAMVTYGGGGQRIYDVTYHEYYIFHWLAAVAQIEYFVCVGLIKMSIAVFNIRLIGMATTRIWKIGNWTFFAILLAYIIIAFFLNVFQCTPAITSFDYVAIGHRGVSPKCLGIAKMNTILRVINVTMDFCLLTVPIVIVLKLQMSWKKKLRIAGLFAFGALACIGSVMGLVSQYALKTDVLWNYTALLGWVLVELVFGVITASLPTLAFLLPGGMSSTADDSATAQSQNNTIHSQRQNKTQERPAMFKLDLGADHIGIMCQDEVELTSLAASEVELEGGPLPYECKVTVMHSRPLPKSEEEQPDRYGPLEYDHGRTER